MTQRTEEDRISEELIRAFMQFGRLRMDAGLRFDPEQEHHGLKRSEVMLLMSLNARESGYPEGISVTDISRFLRVKPPSITSVITGLEQKGLIERTMDLSDRRIVRVRMTEAGRRFIDCKNKWMIEKVRGLVEYLGKEKSAALAGLIDEAYQYYKRRKPFEEQTCRTGNGNGEV